jgi:hypothetical protein
MDPQPLPDSGESPQQPTPPDSKRKRKWVSPALTELPRLTDLTLQTGSPIPGIGDPGGGGSTVF